MKVFAGSAEFKSLKREIDVVRSLPAHENIVMLFGDEEEVRENKLFVWFIFHLWCKILFPCVHTLTDMCAVLDFHIVFALKFFTPMKRICHKKDTGVLGTCIVRFWHNSYVRTSPKLFIVCSP